MKILLSFDIDGTLETGDPPGPVTLEMVKRARDLGCIIGSASDRAISSQKVMWEKVGIEVDFVSNKHVLSEIRERFEADYYLHMGDRELDRQFAERAKKQQKEKAIQDSIDLAEIDKIDLDLDAMWENTVWEEIQDIGEEIVYETEQITAVAGVRGAEAEDEALDHLYYRRSMKGLAIMDLQKAYGKLKIKRDELIKIQKNLMQYKVNNLNRMSKFTSDFERLLNEILKK